MSQIFSRSSIWGFTGTALICIGTYIVQSQIMLAYQECQALRGVSRSFTPATSAEFLLLYLLASQKSRVLERSSSP